MMNQEHIIVVKVTRDDTGLYYAASEDLTGVHVAHRDPQRIIDDMPNIIRLWFRRHRQMEVEVFQGQVRQLDDQFAISAVTIPAEIAAAALGR